MQKCSITAPRIQKVYFIHKISDTRQKMSIYEMQRYRFMNKCPTDVSVPMGDQYAFSLIKIGIVLVDFIHILSR